jgi:hypothetical protein
MKNIGLDSNNKFLELVINTTGDLPNDARPAIYRGNVQYDK